jgi:hypothetical protein
MHGSSLGVRDNRRSSEDTTGIVGRSGDDGNPGDALDMPPSGVILHQRMRRSLVRLFTELRRRKVIQTAVLYAVTAWVLLQVAELLLEMLEVPPWGLKLVFVLLLIGFPLHALGQRAEATNDSGLTDAITNPVMRSLHADPRWAAFVARLRLD